MRSNVVAKMVTIEIFKSSVVNSIMSFGNGSNRQLSINKNDTMVADGDMTNSKADSFVGIVSIERFHSRGQHLC